MILIILVHNRTYLLKQVIALGPRKIQVYFDLTNFVKVCKTLKTRVFTRTNFIHLVHVFGAINSGRGFADTI